MDRKSTLLAVRAALREFAVIVLGVVCALAAQAWWESRQEAEREQGSVKQLVADTEENQRRLAWALEQDGKSLAAASRMMDVFEGRDTAATQAQVAQWVGEAASSSEFRAVTGTFRSLIGTGDLRLLRDEKLRSRIAAHAIDLENEQERLGQIRLVAMEQAKPLAHALPFMLPMLGHGIDKAQIDVKSLRGNVDAAEVFFVLQASHMNRLSGMKRLRDDAAALAASLSPKRPER